MPAGETDQGGERWARAQAPEGEKRQRGKKHPVQTVAMRVWLIIFIVKIHEAVDPWFLL